MFNPRLKTKIFFLEFQLSNLTGGNPVKDPQNILSMACSSIRMSAVAVSVFFAVALSYPTDDGRGCKVFGGSRVSAEL